MRSDAVCPACHARVRRARHAATRHWMLLDPPAADGGVWAVVDWQHTADAARSIPIVARNPTRPALPTRYREHVCPW